MVHNICLRLLSVFLTLGYIAFANSAYPQNWGLLDEALSMLATKKNMCPQGNYTSFSTLNKTFLSTCNFVLISGIRKIAP